MSNPPVCYNLRQIAELAGVRHRTLRRWVDTGVLSHVDFRGPATTYGARQLDEARAARRLRADNLALDTIRTRLSCMSDEELQTFLDPGVVAPLGPTRINDTATQALPAVATVPSNGKALSCAAPTSPAREDGSLPLQAQAAVERWDHLTLMPGLVLLVRADSGEPARRIAGEIRNRYAVVPE